MTRARTFAYWIAPPVVCAILYWPALTSWFRTDDFWWLQFHPVIAGFGDFLAALFGPLSHGTIRSWSERLPFLLFPRWFGLSVWPFRILVFATHAANLILITRIGTRMFASRAAGFAAAILFTVNSGIMLALGWVSAYNQVLCGFFLLLALDSLQRFIETGQRRYYIWQCVAFLLGFGAQETNVVYPAIALAYVLCFAPRYWRAAVPLGIPSIAYVAILHASAPFAASGPYAMHFDGSIVNTFVTYWSWSVSSTYMRAPIPLPGWLIPAGAIVVSLGLLVAAARAKMPGAFCLAWFAFAIAPMLPLRDHVMEYAVYLPVIGLCWLGGAALAERHAAPFAIAAIYLAMTVPEARFTAQWNHDLTMRLRDMVLGVWDLHARAPEKIIVVAGVDDDLFQHAFLELPFRIFGANKVFLSPDTNVSGAQDFIIPTPILSHGLQSGEVTVYDVRRHVTPTSAPASDRSAPRDARE